MPPFTMSRTLRLRRHPNIELNSPLFSGGYRAVMFDRFQGVKDKVRSVRHASRSSP
jgi:hypothetical protein